MSEQKRQKVMLLDDNLAILSMGKKMLQEHYEVYPLPSAERLWLFLESVIPDLIVMDVQMPDMTGFEVLKILKSSGKYADIPVIFLTSKSREMDELEGLALGAVDYVTKPFSAAILLKRIANQLLIKKQQVELQAFNAKLVDMVKQKTSDILDLQGSIVNTFAEIVEQRDAFTGGHINRTQLYIEMLINYLIENESHYSEEVREWQNMETIVSSAKLHDLGKVFISDAILNKPGSLTPEEFDIMKTHVLKGVSIIQRMKRGSREQPFLAYAEIVIGTHHEKWDGSGYPHGLKKEEIPLLGRLMAVADVYDALTSNRSYRKALSREEAAQIILQGSGTHFDPVLVEVFMQVKDQFATVAEWISNNGTEKDLDATAEPV